MCARSHTSGDISVRVLADEVVVVDRVGEHGAALTAAREHLGDVGTQLLGGPVGQRGSGGHAEHLRVGGGDQLGQAGEHGGHGRRRQVEVGDGRAAQVDDRGCGGRAHPRVPRPCRPASSHRSRAGSATSSTASTARADDSRAQRSTNGWTQSSPGWASR